MRRLTQGVADGAQVQAAVLKLGNESQPLQMFLVVECDAALARGGWEGAHPLVVPHGAAGHPRRGGQLVDRIDSRVGGFALLPGPPRTRTALSAFGFHAATFNRYS
jgi:hypothetical protein